MKYKFLTWIMIIGFFSNYAIAGSTNSNSSFQSVIDLADSAISLARSDFQNAEALALRSIEFSESKDFGFGEANALFALGYIYQVNGKKDKAVVFYLQSNAILDEQNTEESVNLNIRCLRNIGMIFHDHFQYDKAVEFFDESIAFADQSNNEKLELAGLYYKARSLKSSEKFNEAIQVLYDASKLSLEINDFTYLIKVNNQLGLLFKEVGDYENSIKHHFEIFAHREMLGEKAFDKQAGIAYHNIANTFLKSGDTVKAEKYFLEAIMVKEGINNKRSAFYSYMDIAEMYKNQQKYELAESYYFKAIGTEVLLDGDPNKFKIYKQLADLALIKGDNNGIIAYNDKYTSFLEANSFRNKEILETDQKYNLQLVTQRYYELVAAQERMAKMEMYGLYSAIFVLMSLATYFTIARVRSVRLKRTIERELKEALVDLNFDDL